MTLKQAIKDPSWLLERMSNQKVEGNDGPGFRHVDCPEMLWEELVRLVEGLKVEEGRVAQTTGGPIESFSEGDELPTEQELVKKFAGIIVDDVSDSSSLAQIHRNVCDHLGTFAQQLKLTLECYPDEAAQHLKREQERRCTCVVMTPRNIYPGGRHLDDSCPVHTIQPREQEPAPGELRKAVIEELYKRHDGLSPQWIDDFAAFVVRVAAQPPQELVSLREAGWMVAVHNDYRQDGKLKTFWLFVKDGRAIKGEGDTDAEALVQVARAALTRGAVGGTK